MPALPLAVQSFVQCSNQRSASGSGPEQPCTVVPDSYWINGSVEEMPMGELSLVLARDGATLFEHQQALNYQDRYPNGPECGAVCRQELVEITLPAQ